MYHGQLRRHARVPAPTTELCRRAAHGSLTKAAPRLRARSGQIADGSTALQRTRISTIGRSAGQPVLAGWPHHTAHDVLLHTGSFIHFRAASYSACGSRPAPPRAAPSPTPCRSPSAPHTPPSTTGPGPGQARAGGDRGDGMRDRRRGPDKSPGRAAAVQRWAGLGDDTGPGPAGGGGVHGDAGVRGSRQGGA
jgi:hypothetical protein